MGDGEAYPLGSLGWARASCVVRRSAGRELGLVLRLQLQGACARPPGKREPRLPATLTLPQESEPSPVGPSVGGGRGRDGPVALGGRVSLPLHYPPDGSPLHSVPRVTLPFGVRGHTELGPLARVISAQSAAAVRLPSQHQCFRTIPPGPRLPPAGRRQSSFPPLPAGPAPGSGPLRPPSEVLMGGRQGTAGHKDDGPQRQGRVAGRLCRRPAVTEASVLHAATASQREASRKGGQGGTGDSGGRTALPTGRWGGRGAPGAPRWPRRGRGHVETRGSVPGRGARPCDARAPTRGPGAGSAGGQVGFQAAARQGQGGLGH